MSDETVTLYNRWWKVYDEMKKTWELEDEADKIVCIT